MDYQHIKWEKEDNFGVITLNRPKSLNALSRELLGELEALVTEIDQDEKIGAYIITGAPHRTADLVFPPGQT